MKKQLLAGTALVVAAVFAAGGAMAADKKMADKKKMMKPAISVNGSYEAVVGGILDEDTGTDTSALDVRTDAEIHFNGRAALESGMKVHARVELEGMDAHANAKYTGDPIDEYFIAVSGSFGQIILGGTAGAPVKMLTGLSGSWATGVGELLNFDNGWVPSVAGNHYNLQHSRLDTQDGEKATYLSPKFGGFQVGLTYSPNRAGDDDNSRNDVDSDVHDGIEGAVSYSGKFGDVGFGVGAGMTAYQGANTATTVETCIPVAGATEMDPPTTSCSTSTNSTDDLSDWLVAARLDFGGGFRVAIAHKRVTNDNEASHSQLTDVGVRYVAGPNSFSLVGSKGEMDEGDISHTAIMGSYARALGAGVKVHMNLIWNETESGAAENSGLAAIAGIKVVF